MTINKGDFDAQQFLTAVSSGNPPDLVYMGRQLIGTYAAKGAIQPLDQCISGQKIDTSQYRPAAMQSVTLADKVYGIPEFYIVQANLIDGTALGSAGVTPEQIQTKDWDALAATSAKLFRAGRLEDQADRLRPQAAGLVPAVGDGQRRRHRR